MFCRRFRRRRRTSPVVLEMLGDTEDFDAVSTDPNRQRKVSDGTMFSNCCLVNNGSDRLGVERKPIVPAGRLTLRRRSVLIYRSVAERPIFQFERRSGRARTSPAAVRDGVRVRPMPLTRVAYSPAPRWSCGSPSWPKLASRTAKGLWRDHFQIVLRSTAHSFVIVVLRLPVCGQPLWPPTNMVCAMTMPCLDDKRPRPAAVDNVGTASVTSSDAIADQHDRQPSSRW